MPVAIPILAGALIAGGTSAITSSMSAAATKKANANQASATPDASQTVGDPAKANATNLGRAALISTSPSGVQGSDPTGRRKLLGND